MSELIAISALIGDRTYRIKIQPGDEEMVRKSLKTINDSIIDFKTKYAGKDMQDYVAMALIWFATEQKPITPEGQSQASLLEELQKMEKLIDPYLSR